MKNRIFTLLISFLTLTGCTNKTYYYKEGSKEEKVITASSDSMAYLKAYEYFVISKKTYADMKKSLGDVYINEPISFDLLDDKHNNITYKISFDNKDSAENRISKSINELPNHIEESVTRVREEKNGIGAKYDTGGLYLSPIKVVSAKFVTKEYSNYKDISLRFKNVSSKVVTAIRFKWYGENAFNEPADMGGLREGWGGGFTDDAIRPGASDYGEWSILSKDGKKILIAYPYEVVYKDGTKWELPN
jgi:hypothetical protein